MTIQELATTRLAADIYELLDAMILELELRGCEANHPLVKRALIIQEQLNTQKENGG